MMGNVIELLPLFIFYYFYTQYDIFHATSALIASTVLTLVYFRFSQGKVKKSQWVISGIVITLGAFTVLLRDPVYIMWKPTIINGAIASILLIGPLAFKKYPLKLIVPKEIAEFGDNIWRIIHIIWGVFLANMAMINIYIAEHKTMDEWVNFKIFISPIVTLLMTIVTLVIVKALLTRQINKEALADE